MSLTSYQAAPPCNVGEEKGAPSTGECQRLSLFQAHPDLGVSRLGVLEGEGHCRLRELLDPYSHRLDEILGRLDLHREYVALLVELAVHGQLDGPVPRHDTAHPDRGDRALKERLRDVGRRDPQLD